MSLRTNWKSAPNLRGGSTAPQWQKPSNPELIRPRPSMPDKIVKDILSRLPVKSLLRFKGVNKHWNSMISDSNFALSNDHRAKAVFMDRNSHFVFFHFINDEAAIEDLHWRIEEDRIGSDPFEPFECCSQFIAGSCNGLLLVVLQQSFLLWNPSTRYIRKVLELRRLDDPDYRVVSGLCFDSLTDDYKVVMGLAHLTPDYGGDFVMVARLKEKQWRQVKFPHRISRTGSGPLVNGFLHWKVGLGHHPFNRFWRPQKIVAFDPNADEFKDFPMPQAKHRDGNLILGLGVLGGCLSMARWDNESDRLEGNIEVLVMKEYGVKESWTIMFEISNLSFVVPDLSSKSPFYTRLRPLLLMRNGEILLSYENKIILIYNPKEMTYKICDHIEKYRYGSENIFVESLVSPSGCEWLGKTSSKEIIWLKRQRRQDTSDSEDW